MKQDINDLSIKIMKLESDINIKFLGVFAYDDDESIDSALATVTENSTDKDIASLADWSKTCSGQKAMEVFVKKHLNSVSDYSYLHHLQMAQYIYKLDIVNKEKDDILASLVAWVLEKEYFCKASLEDVREVVDEFKENSLTLSIGDFKAEIKKMAERLKEK